MITTVKFSMLQSRINVGTPDRYSGRYANPTGNVGAITRETAPLKETASPRIQHPKLNTKPWSVSMAVKRQPMPRRSSKKVMYG